MSNKNDSDLMLKKTLSKDFDCSLCEHNEVCRFKDKTFGGDDYIVPHIWRCIVTCGAYKPVIYDGVKLGINHL